MAGFLWRWNPFRRRVQAPVCPLPDNCIASTISDAESELVFVQSLAVWENPVNSILALIAVNAGIWAVGVLQLRLASVVATLALFRLVRCQWRERIWPEIRVPPPVPDDTEPWTDVSATALSAPEMIRYAERMQRAGDNLVTGVAQFRRNTPLLFVFVVNMCWSLLYMLSGHVSGTTLAQLALNLLLTVPALLLHWLPPGTSDQLRQMAEDATGTLKNWGMMGADCESEFVPESTPETTAYLDAMADIINGRESTPECQEVAAFSSGLEAAPDFDASDDTDDDLAPSLDGPAYLSLDRGGAGVDRDANSSSAAGDAGLDVASSAAATLGAQALSSATQLLSGAGRIVSAVYNTQTFSQHQQDSDSDFEFIDEDFAGDKAFTNNENR